MPTPPRDRRDAGGDWEARARAHLEGHGLCAVAANVGYRFGELDLVMKDGAVLVFVEVRYRRQAGFGGAVASVDARKCRRIALAARGFLAAHPAHATRACRFDVVAIDGPPDSPRIDWLRDAFRLEDC